MRAALPVLLLAAACAAGPGYAPLPAVRVQPVAGATPPPARGETRLDVVAVSLDGAGRETEIPGAGCRARSPYFAADFAAPARLLLPDYGSLSPPVEVTCRAGERSGRAVAAPDWQWVNGMGPGGVVPSVGISVGTGNSSGVGVGLGWYGGGWSTAAPGIRYPALRVVLD